MEKFEIVNLVSGVLLIVLGCFFTFKPKLTYQKEGISDIFAIVGIIFMVIGVVLLFSPLLNR